MTFRTLHATTHWLLQEKRIVIPSGAILFLHGANPAHVDWTAYTMVNNLLYGSTSAATNSVTAAGAASASATGSSQGGHYGTYSLQIHSFSLFAAPWETGDNNYGGDHTHSGFTVSSSISQAYMSVGTVKANKDTKVIPSGCSFILASGSTPPGSTGIFGGSITYPAYVRVGATTGGTGVTAGTYSSTGSGSSGSNFSTHRHHTTSGANIQFAYYPFTTLSNNNGLSYNSTGIHSHSISYTATGGRLGTTKHVQFWQATQEQEARSNIILGWDSASAPPAPWYLCDGNNGTETMNGYWIAHTPSLGYHGTFGSESFALAAGTSGEGAQSHSHNVVSSTGYQSAGNFLYGHHVGQSNFHSHSFSVGAGSAPYPARTAMKFIQYKG